ncbi:hypothetical protein [Streptomyces sp. NPDC101150]|uniref:hypothetical protein n=1 Tax=Streptomyces sp. NPDC101150 TaxID=3366114 RepID=UPI00381A6797
MAEFEATHGYPPGTNEVRPAAPAEQRMATALRLSSHPDLAPDLATLYATVHEVSLPDIGRGCFLHQAGHVLAELTTEGPVRLGPDPGHTGVVFGSDGGDGGGMLFAIDRGGRIHRSRTASRDGDFEPCCDSLREFLTGIQRAVSGGAGQGAGTGPGACAPAAGDHTCPPGRS